MAAANNPLHYKRIGLNGPIWVLVHGFLETHSMWTTLVEACQATHQFVMIDLPGHGSSDSRGSTCHMWEMAHAVKEILDLEQIDQAHFMGHSMGGYVLLELLDAHAHLFQSIVLLNSTTQADSKKRLLGREQALRLLEQDQDRYVQFAIRGLFHPDDLDRYEEPIKQLISAARKFPAEGISAAIRGMAAREDRTDLLKSFSGIKWAIYGTRDPLIPAQANTEWTSRALTQNKIFETGHMIWLEEPHELVQFVHFIE